MGTAGSRVDVARLLVAVVVRGVARDLGVAGLGGVMGLPVRSATSASHCAHNPCAGRLISKPLAYLIRAVGPSRVTISYSPAAFAYRPPTTNPVSATGHLPLEPEGDTRPVRFYLALLGR